MDGNCNVAGDIEIVRASARPVPVIVAVALAVATDDERPRRLAGRVGWNWTEMTHEPPGGTIEFEQASVSVENGAANGVTAPIATPTVDGLLNETFAGWDDDPIATVPRSIVPLGDTFNVGSGDRWAIHALLVCPSPAANTVTWPVAEMVGDTLVAGTGDTLTVSDSNVANPADVARTTTIELPPAWATDNATWEPSGVIAGWAADVVAIGAGVPVTGLAT